MKLSVALCTY